MISAKTWNSYVAAQRAVRLKADKKVTEKAEALRRDIAEGLAEAEAIDELVRYAYAVATEYGIMSATLAAELYDKAAEMLGLSLPAAELAETATIDEVAKAVKATAASGGGAVGAATGRLVKRAGADTTLKNAIRDGAEWAWIPHGDSCAFCLTLASNGWQPASKKILKGGHAEHIHANCDCNFAIKHNAKGGVEGYDYKQYEALYENAHGNTSKEKINSIRKAQYAAMPTAKKEQLNAQKRAAYAARKEQEKQAKA